MNQIHGHQSGRNRAWRATAADLNYIPQPPRWGAFQIKAVLRC